MRLSAARLGDHPAIVARAGERPFHRVYKPEAYGAVVDGVTDDTAAVIAMAADMPAAGSVAVISPDTVWQPSLVTFPEGSAVWDYSAVAGANSHAARVWVHSEFQIVGHGNNGPTETGNAGYVVLVNAEPNVWEPHSSGIVSMFGEVDTPGFSYTPYNNWQFLFGAWGDIRFAATITGTTTLTSNAGDQFVASDVGRRIYPHPGTQTTIATYVSPTVVTLATPQSNGAVQVGFWNADDLVLFGYQPNARYRGGVADRVAPESGGTSVARLQVSQRGAFIFNPNGILAQPVLFDPYAAADVGYYFVMNGGDNKAVSTTRLLLCSGLAGGAVGVDFWTNNGDKKKRLELVDTTGNLRIRNEADDTTLWEITDTGVITTVPIPWIPVTFTNSWVNQGGGYQGVEYRKVDDVVTLRGVMKDGTGGVEAFALPAGYRPPLAEIFASKRTGATGDLTIDNGAGGCYPSDTGTFVSVSGISFSVTP